MFESFGYKHGIPGDADFVFDVRSLPNPYWEHALRKSDRPRCGRDRVSAGFASVRSMIADLTTFLEKRVERVLAGESQLLDHRHRLHRRPASFGIHRRAAGGTFSQIAPAGADAA